MRSSQVSLKLIVMCLLLAPAGPIAADAPKIGDPAPEIRLEALLQAQDGAEATLAALRGNVIVLEFWATWCQPCLAYGIPHTNELAKTFDGKPVTFISITDEQEDLVQRCIKRIPIQGWIGLDLDRSVMTDYDIQSIPKTILIDTEGRLAAYAYSTVVTEEAIERLLAGDTIDLPTAYSTAAPLVAGADPTQGTSAVEDVEPLYQVVIRKLPTEPETKRASMTYGAMTREGWSLRDAFQAAIGIPGDRIEGPDRLDTTFVSFAVRMPPGSEDKIGETLLAALEPSFGLTARRESRLLPAAVLRVADDGLKMTKGKPMNTIQALDGELNAVGTELVLLKSMLQENLGLPVIDETGLPRASFFDFTLRWDPEQPETLFDAVPEQLGLRLDKTAREQDVLVVTEVKPSDNSQ